MKMNKKITTDGNLIDAPITKNSCGVNGLTDISNPNDKTELFRSIVEDSAIGVFIADKKERNILYFNDAFCKICGFESESIRGRILYDVIEKYNKKVLLEKEEIELLSYDIFSEFHVTRGELYLAIKSKSLIWNGKEAYILYIADETSEQKKSQLAMREQKYYRMILNMTGIAYFEWDKNGGFYSSSEYFNYEISKGGYDAIMGNDIGGETIYKDDLPVLVYYMKEIVENVEGKSITIRMKMKDGHYQWTEIVGYAEKENDGRFSRLVGILRNVDNEWIKRNKRLKAALEEAEKANKAKTDFLSRVSHDMRTPLNGILGLTEFIKESVKDEKVIQDISQLELSGQYLLNLINDTLDVSRIENGRLELHPIVCDGKAIFDGMIKLAKPNIEAKNINFKIIAEDIPFNILYIDVARLEQIVMNIIGNSVKFTPEQGTIEFKIENLSVEDGVITDKISITDTGIGMSKEFLPKIFDAFSQDDNASTNSRQGTGLGMAITKQLVDLMGGEISVKSELDKGTCFMFTIQMSIATEQQIKEWNEQKNTITNDSILKGKRVLLCEDHPINKKIAVRLLEKKGMIVDHAENGSIGVDKFKKSTIGYYDLILMDIRMPILDGMDATRQIRREERKDANTIPIIAMTGNSFDDDVLKALDAGMNEHLSKPINIEKFYRVISNQLKAKTRFIRKKIMIVDDVDLNRDIIKMSISKDYECFEASNGVEALTILNEKTGINAIITDIMMPKMDGIELIKIIRANSDFDKVAIIANTQYDEITNKTMLEDIGVNEIIYKPNTPENIARHLRVALRKV